MMAAMFSPLSPSVPQYLQHGHNNASLTLHNVTTPTNLGLTCTEVSSGVRSGQLKERHIWIETPERNRKNLIVLCSD